MQPASVRQVSSGRSARRLAVICGRRVGFMRYSCRESGARQANKHWPARFHGPIAAAMAVKRRIDQLLVERGLAESRARAQALVMAGLVFAGETRVAKPGHQVREDMAIEVRGRDHPWVGRGGVKLDHAIAHFGLDPSGAVAMDIGSSTGGFTEVLL